MALRGPHAAWPPCRLASLPPGLPAAWPPCRLTSLPPGLLVAYAKPTFSLELSAKSTFSLELSAKPTFSASWRPRRLPDGPPGAQDGLRTSILAPETAQDGPGCDSWRSKRPPGAQTASARGSWRSRRASWRPRRPPDGPAGALDSAKDGSSWRSSLALKKGLAPRRPLHGAPGALDGPPGAQDGLQTGLLALLAPKTASGRSSWRSRPWVPLLALKTGLLAHMTASGQASWSAKQAFDA